MANILIVDPNPSMRQTILDTLKSFGHKLFEAGDAAQAMEMVKSKNILTVLSDTEPGGGMDGVELIKEIKIFNPSISVVMMIGLGEETSKIIEAGAFATLSKPFNVQGLRRMITEAIDTAKNAPPPPKTPVQKEIHQSRKRIIIRIIIALMAIGLLSAGFITYLSIFRKNPVRTYIAHYSNISSITFDGKSLLSCDWSEQNIYQHKLDAILSLEKKVYNDEWHPSALAWDGKNIWSYSSWDKKLYKHQLGNIEKYELEIPITELILYSIFYSGNYFWFTDTKNLKVGRFKVDGNQISGVEMVNSPGKKPVGIFQNEEGLWSADSQSGLVYRHQNKPGLPVQEVYTFPKELLTEEVSSFTTDGKNFWVTTVKGPKIFQFEQRNLIFSFESTQTTP